MSKISKYSYWAYCERLVIAENIFLFLIWLCFLSFFILKVSNVITWSWWWILSPLWLTIALSITVSSIDKIVENIKNYLEETR